MPVIVVKAKCDPFEIIDTERKVLKPPLPCPRRRMSVKIQGTLVQFKREAVDAIPPTKKLGCVIGQFSNASRLRLLKYLNTIQWEEIGNSTFITLTYPDVIDTSRYLDRDKHRYLILRRLEKYLGEKFPCIWRIEWEVRKTGVCKGLLRPHFHLCCMNLPHVWISVLRSWWGKIIGYQNNNLQVDVATVTGFQGCLLYIAKYVSKIPTLDIPLNHNNRIKFGRHWGATRKQLIPRSPVVLSRWLTAVEQFLAIEWADRSLKKYDMELQNGFTLLGEEHAEFFERVLKNP